MGRKLMNRFLQRLTELGIVAVHLEVGKSNTGAVAFYKRTGFHQVMESDYSIVFGIRTGT